METPLSAKAVTDEMRAATAEARERARVKGDELVSEARDQAHAFAVEKRDGAASYVSDLADALDRATEVLSERGRSGSAQYAQMAVRRLHELGNRVDRQNVNSWIDEVESVARERPLLVFGGAFLLGYAFMRFLGGDRRADYSRAVGSDRFGDPSSSAGADADHPMVDGESA
jgi:hypothetical protein